MSPVTSTEPGVAGRDLCTAFHGDVVHLIILQTESDFPVNGTADTTTYDIAWDVTGVTRGRLPVLAG